ncbi:MULTISPECIES: SIR2 family protein [Lactobacillus]|uniref:SIR2 family protein n=1 Tax=Lactobacillus TaxID=1578 RepID=UPI000B5DB817|nr:MULTISPECIES: SIR2 family protein [Lactobacillus]MDU7058446.1 SIR2 family protein [Ligilactobacillus salivarius]OXC41103.1 hypothetical protein AYP94_10025 [Lactobacillus crispatus]OXC44598.1 hypothetical protein AYP95_07565 [Lactobacillus crispatus]PEG83253.1 hypothetical protein CP367_04635 [Lactobacillus sp. UMNPBX16]PEG98065.1 hypothetical protein CP359_09080 [Lactobacillus sp. UMNPBX8]
MKIKELRKLIISKRLNFILGSGCSTPAIPLMGEFWKKYPENKDKANEKLEEEIKRVSNILVSQNVDQINVYNKEIHDVLDVYIYFIQKVIEYLNLSNARETPRRTNIFTTNYDLFIEKAFDILSQNYRFVINDGAKGYFNRILESSNFDQVVSYKGMNDNYISEIPSIALIKPHGSVNWEKDSKNESLFIRNRVVSNPVIVKPTGFEAEDTFNQNHFFSMLRFFTNELDKPQSVLVVIGFSFQDKHIARMVRRAIANPELLVICFCYSTDDVGKILANLQIKMDEQGPVNLKFVVPENNKGQIKNLNILKHEDKITLETVVRFMNGAFDETDDE